MTIERAVVIIVCAFLQTGEYDMSDIMVKDNGDGGDVVLREPLTQTGDTQYIDLMGGETTFGSIGRYLITTPDSYGGRVWVKGTITIKLKYDIFIPGHPPIGWVVYDSSRSALHRTLFSAGLRPDLPGYPPKNSEAWVQTEPPFPAAASPALDYAEPYLFKTPNADLYPDTGIGTAVYMSLFDAPGWMEGFKTAEEKVQSLGSLEQAFNDPITRGSMARLKAIAESNLRWLTDDGVCSQIQIAVRNPELGYIEIDITATEPNDVRNRYKLLWNKEEQKLVSFVRSPDRPNVILSP